MSEPRTLQARANFEQWYAEFRDLGADPAGEFEVYGPHPPILCRTGDYKIDRVQHSWEGFLGAWNVCGGPK